MIKNESGNTHRPVEKVAVMNESGLLWTETRMRLVGRSSTSLEFKKHGTFSILYMLETPGMMRERGCAA